MIKTIKQVKEMRLDELIKYVWDNDIQDVEHESRSGKRIYIKSYTIFHLEEGIHRNDVFEITEEEPITENTEFESVVINTEKSIYTFCYISIKESRSKLPEAIEIFARIDGRLQKVWEKDGKI